MNHDFNSRTRNTTFMAGFIACTLVALPLKGSEYMPEEGLFIPNSHTQHPSQLKDSLPIRHSEALYYHTFRDSLHNSRTVFTNEKHGRVALT